MKRLHPIELEYGVYYIARTNEDDPPILCILSHFENHASGDKFPIFKNIEGAKSSTFTFMGPVIKFDQAIYDKLKSMTGREGYDWLVANSEK
jgi:hypothetical protein